MDPLQDHVLELAKKSNALILAHYYQEMRVQEIAHIVGDSFALAKKAKDSSKQLLVLCGVRFMAETAKILCPKKTVLLPVADAGCIMADMITPEDVLALKEAHPGAAVVCYVNSSAAVKAVSDVCCTSSSAVKIVKALPQKEIIFVPDQNLGAYVASQVPGKTIYLHPGFCPIHHACTPLDVQRAKKAHPGAVFLAHPECRPEVVKLADRVGSTAAILEWVEKSPPGSSFLIGTEEGVVQRIRHQYPDRSVYLLRSGMTCVNMKKTTLEDVAHALQTMMYAVEVEPATAKAAKGCLEKMVTLGSK